MMNDDITQRPNRIPWPPILAVGAVFAAWILEAVWPTGEMLDGAGRWARVTGILVAATGLGFDLAAMLTMHRARTNILPHRAAGHLVTNGVFALSRSPFILATRCCCSVWRWRCTRRGYWLPHWLRPCW